MGGTHRPLRHRCDSSHLHRHQRRLADSLSGRLQRNSRHQRPWHGRSLRGRNLRCRGWRPAAFIGSVLLGRPDKDIPEDWALEEAGEKKCPDCAETVLADAKVCKHCGYRFAPAGPSPAPRPKPEELTPPKTASNLPPQSRPMGKSQRGEESRHRQKDVIYCGTAGFGAVRAHHRHPNPVAAGRNPAMATSPLAKR